MQGAHGGTRVMASDAADPSFFKSTKVDSREMLEILPSCKSTKVDSCYTRSSQTVCKPEKAQVTKTLLIVVAKHLCDISDIYMDLV